MFGAKTHNHYTVECWAPCQDCLEAGRPHDCEHKTLRWRDGFDNIVVTLGLNALLNNTFQAAAGSVNWYVGLKNSGTVALADTMSSHAGWTENATYSNANRPAYTNNGVASGGATSNSSSKATFNINGSTTIYGAFLTSDNTVSGTSGTLYGAGDFSGSRAVVSGDTLNVEVDLSIT